MPNVKSIASIYIRNMLIKSQSPFDKFVDKFVAQSHNGYPVRDATNVKIMQVRRRGTIVTRLSEACG